MYHLGMVSSSAKLLQAASWQPKVTPGMADLLGTNLVRSAMAANMVPVMDHEGKIYYYDLAEG